MAIVYNQRNVTNNQSTLDVSTEVVFLYDNKYQTAVFKNTTAGDLDLEQGVLVRRDTSTPGQVIPAIAGATLADVIGIVKVNSPKTLAADETANINYAISGDVDSGLLVLPATVTLDTTVGNKHLRDILSGLGFNLKPLTELTSFDN